MRESIYGATLEDDAKRADYIDTVVARLFRGPVRQTQFPASAGETRINCSDGPPVQRPHEDGARGHRRGGSGLAGGG